MLNSVYDFTYGMRKAKWRRSEQEERRGEERRGRRRGSAEEGEREGKGERGSEGERVVNEINPNYRAGDDAFRKIIQEYLLRFQYSNAAAADLWACFNSVNERGK